MLQYKSALPTTRTIYYPACYAAESSFTIPRARAPGVDCILSAEDAAAAYNFTLAALNTTLPNANDTGVPLVLGLECMMTDREQTTAPADRPLVVFDYSAIYWTSVRSEPFLADLCTMLC